MAKKLVLEAGNRFPHGATARPGGVNFSLFSRRATKVWLRLYRRATDATPLAELELDPREHRTYAWWHAFVAGAQPGLVLHVARGRSNRRSRGPPLRPRAGSCSIRGRGS